MKNSLARKLLSIFAFLYLLQLIITSVFIYRESVEDSKNALLNLLQHVNEGIVYKDGTYDLAKYDADPQIPGRFILYVFTPDGYVIERWRPIPGLLDTSNFKQLLSFTTAQTFNTVTNERWRMHSVPILDDTSTIIGVVTVAWNDHHELTNFEAVDEKLHNTARDIQNQVSIQDGNIIINNIDVKQVPFDIPFQIVDRYNKILMKTNNVSIFDRLPNFIDPSYVKEAMQNPPLQKRNFNGEPYLVASKNLLNSDNHPVGVIVAAWPLSRRHTLLYKYVLSSIATVVVLTGVFGIITSLLTKKKTTPFPLPTHLNSYEIESISFSKKDGMLKINNKSIHFAYTTNQYYMCQVLFSIPGKRWENDQILEKFGEYDSHKGWRKVYDAMVAINAKVSEIMDDKLIVNDNKTYQINPRLVSKIIKI